MAEIGEMLREARMRRRIDMTEVESATKIRGKYLRALENEEWDLLPGPTFVKTFLRTYAEYLGLDPRLLVEEYRQRYERPSTQDLTPFSATRSARGRARRRRAASMGPLLVIAGCAAVLLGALWALGTWGNDD
jgi:cytoskeletal protein RodZ